MNRKQRFLLLAEIAKRAESLDLLRTDRLSLIMDLDFTDTQCPLKLQDLLQADIGNFTHDVVGIQNHMDRANKKLDEMFLPRYADEELV